MKRTTKVVIGLVAILMLGAGVYGYTLFNTYAPTSYIVETSSPTSPNGKTITTVNSGTGEVTAGGKTFTDEEIAKHNSEASCYSIVHDTVYDLTLWIHAHPGGQEVILSMCGRDGTKEFMDEHKGRAKFMNVLARFKIGTRA